MLEIDGAMHGPLHLSHPLVVEAVRAARVPATWAPARVTVPGVTKGPATMRVVKLGIDGFERVEQLLPVVVTSDGEAVDAPTALQVLLSLSPAGERVGVRADAFPAVDDAVDQAVFFAQAGLDAAEHHRFERASVQGERFVEDRLLVLRKRKGSLSERFDLATQRRDGATGSEAREDAERARTGLQRQLDTVDEEMDRLARRDDPRFQKHQDHIQQRRYAPPRLETLFDLDLVIE